MENSRERILCTHVGSLPRKRELSDLLIAEEQGAEIDQARLNQLSEEGIKHCVEKQVASGIDVINDGEQPRVGFQTYVGQRLSGFGGTSERLPFADFARYEDFGEVWSKRGMVYSSVFDAPAADGEVKEV